MISTHAPENSATGSDTAKLRSLHLSGPAGRLETLLNEGLADAPFAALVCHPHPKGGGTMHNKVVYHAMKVLNAPEWGLSWPVLRFNFRGTGLSEGAHDGNAEADDVLAAIEWLENEYRRPLIVAGFSFGAVMALLACCERGGKKARASVHAIAALGLPTQAEGRHYRHSFLAGCRVPKFFLSGDRDNYAPEFDLRQVVATTAEPRKLALIPGADHFFTGQLQAMQSALSGWLKEELL